MGAKKWRSYVMIFFSLSITAVGHSNFVASAELNIIRARKHQSQPWIIGYYLSKIMFFSEYSSKWLQQISRILVRLWRIMGYIIIAKWWFFKTSYRWE